MGQRPRPLFVARGTYRQRRWRDAARLLPVLGALLFMLPLLWQRGETQVSVVLLYIFAVWAGLIGLAVILSRRLRDDPEAPGAGPP